jgi:hypothetical protein
MRAVIHKLLLLLPLLAVTCPAAGNETAPVLTEPASLPESSLSPGTESYRDKTAALILSECRRIADKLGSVNLEDCLDREFMVSADITVNGAPILYKEYPPLETRNPMGRVLLVGGIHGDEYSSVSIVFKWMKTLDVHHSGMFHWHIVPLLNPDGLLRPESQRMNANNVDLNRNFPMDDWLARTSEYWINATDSNPRRFPGTTPLSEPESRWLAAEIDHFHPDVIVAVHAPHGVVDYDGPEDGPYKLGRLYLQLIGTFPGSLGNYAGIQKQIPVVTIELPYAGIMPTASDISHIWTDLISWLRENIDIKPLPVAGNQETDPS